jgi:hypothetical protein
MRTQETRYFIIENENTNELVFLCAGKNLFDNDEPKIRDFLRIFLLAQQKYVFAQSEGNIEAARNNFYDAALNGLPCAQSSLGVIFLIKEKKFSTALV